MKYFTIKELTHSDTATARGIDNTPTEEAVKHLTLLIERLLDPLREAWGKPIKVTSGYRGFRLNKTVGGSNTSAHCYGYAADLVPMGGEPIGKFKAFVKEWLKISRVKYDQYIDEKNARGAEWVHLAVCNRNGEQRKQNLKQRGGKYYAL